MDGPEGLRAFEDRWQPRPSYTDALWGAMRFHHGVFARTLDESLRYLRRRDATLVHVEPRCLTPAEKIGVLLEVARSGASVAGYRERLVAALTACESAESERQRVVREYRLAGEHAWMYPVVEAIDRIGDAAFELDETMYCENEDYRQMNSRERFGEDSDYEDPEGSI